MTGDIGTALVTFAGDALAAVFAVADGSRVRRLLRAAGWVAPADLDVDGMAEAIGALADSVRGRLEDPPTDLVGLAQLLGDIGAPLVTLAEGVESAGAPPELIDDVAEVLLTATLAQAGPTLSLLELLGVAETVSIPALPPSGGWHREATRRTRLHLDRVGPLISDPLARLRALAADPGSLAAAAWPLLVDALVELNIGATTGETGPDDPNAPTARRVLVVDLPMSRVPPEFVRIAVGVDLDDQGSLEAFAVASPDLAWQVQRGGWRAQVRVPGPQRVHIGRDGVTVTDGLDEIALDVGYRSSTTPALRLGDPQGTSIEVGLIDAALSLTPGGPPDVGGRVKLEGIRLHLAGGDGDSFLASVLPAAEAGPSADLELTWSLRTGLRLSGSAELVWRSGAVELALDATGSGITASAGAMLPVRLGPVAAVVDRVGLTAKLDFTAGAGNLGPAAVGLGFKPPTGLALSVDAGMVTGGGFLFFDARKAQYAGGLHLEFEGGITLNAFGLLTTRMPDGSPGFSLLVIVQASGFAPIQLGLGFTINGVGGLLGINRTVAVDVLRAGLRNRSLDAILFSPDDPTPRAPQIVSTLQSVFPPAPDRFVFGPMAIIGWGTPTILTLEIALLLELPAPVRLVVLGRLRAVLPDAAHAVVKINMDLLGVIDFDRREASIDATLYDSAVGPYALTGDMAARANWGAAPDFVVSLGGLHPSFAPPPNFPTLRRLALSLATGDNPRVRMEAYLALTPNTVQLGARLELFVEAAGFAVEGDLGFDTLLNLSPFRLRVEIDAYLALKRSGRTLLSLSVHVTLTGPSPWDVWGEAKFTLLFVKITVAFRARFGEEAELPPAEGVEVWPLLHAGLADARNWSAQLPGGASQLATFRAESTDGEALAHPLGTISVAQRAVPLERTLSLFGAAPPKDYQRFEITGAVGLALGEDIHEHFAPAQFRRMTDAEKLASPAFDRMVGGARLGPTEAVRVGREQEVPLAYETAVILDLEEPAAGLDRYEPPSDAVATLAQIGPAADAPARTQGRARFAVDQPAPSLAEPDYVLASRDQLAEEDAPAIDGSYTAALEALAARPDRENLQIVRRHELELVRP